MNKQGFSLLELMVVLSFFMMLVIAVTTSLTIFTGILVRAEMNELYALCRLLQHRAIAEQHTITLAFDPSNNRYTYDGHTHQLHERVCFGHAAVGESFKGMTSTFLGNHIRFFSTGIIQAGSLYLMDQGKNYRYALTCPVGSVSYLRVYRYQGNEWVELQ